MLRTARTPQALRGESASHGRLIADSASVRQWLAEGVSFADRHPRRMGIAIRTDAFTANGIAQLAGRVGAGSEQPETQDSSGNATLVGLGRLRFVNIFVFRRRVRRRLPKSDAVRNVPVRGEGVLSFNQRGSEIAKQHQGSDESKKDNNGLPRNKYQHESTSGGLRATCNSLPFYRRMFCRIHVKIRCPSSFRRTLFSRLTPSPRALGNWQELR